MDKLVETHSMTFNPEDNGGEATSIDTSVWKDKTGHRFFTQEIKQGCYGRETTISLPYTFTPEKLRKLANELEQFVLLHIKAE